MLEHIVDTVLYFEGDTHSSFRLVRAFKNRFGAVNELGVFAMTEKGLKGVSNPSALFLSQHDKPVPGSCVMVTQEGTRPLLVEIQALVDTSHAPNARRLSVGLEQNRLAMLLAVLHRHAGIAAFDQDVFINAVGGVKITEPAADLAVLLAIHSSMRNKPLPRGLVVFGEVGLAGEIRPAPRGQERLREAAKLGFSIALIPKANAPKQKIEGMTIIAVERIDEAFDPLRELGQCRRSSSTLRQLGRDRCCQCLVAERNGRARGADHDRQQSGMRGVELTAIENKLAPDAGFRVVDQREKRLCQLDGGRILQIAGGDRFVVKRRHGTSVDQISQQGGRVPRLGRDHDAVKLLRCRFLRFASRR